MPPELDSFFDRYCYECHDPDTEEGGLDLFSLSTELERPEVMRVWVRIHDRVRDGEMPPPKKPRPAPGQQKAFLTSLATGLTRADEAIKGTVLRRLNRHEFENTLNDMLGTRERLAGLLPEDGQAHGFDNVGEALDLSSVHLERYMTAATKAIDAAIRTTPKPERQTSQHSLADGKNENYLGKHWHRAKDGSTVVFNNGRFPRPAFQSFRAPAEGKYSVKISGYAYQSTDPVSFELWAGNYGLGGVAEVAATPVFEPGAPHTYELELWLKPRASFVVLPNIRGGSTRDLRKAGPAAYEGPGLAFSGLEVEGPIYDEWPGRGHELLFGGIEMREVEPDNPRRKNRPGYVPVLEPFSPSPATDAERLLRRFLPVAFRRPISDADVAPLLALAKSELAGGAPFAQAMRTTYLAAICTPDFLYLREPEGRLDGFALASRLSYALWNTLPDERLVKLAASGRLSAPEVLRAETERLLSDPRASRFATNFIGQWLNLRDIDFTTPDGTLYPEYDDQLRDAMVAETESFFAKVLEENLSALNFIDSDWTMVNERLARHYGIEGVEGQEMRPVSLRPEHRRGGVMTHASVLKVSANGTTTSPVLRGVYVLERILGVDPPPPPPNVPGVEPDIRGTSTLREQLEKHREVESCNNCHRIIDPPGFALENYDVMGGWRENYRSLNKDFPAPSPKLRAGVRNAKWRVGPEVDASSETFDGQPFTDLDEYKRILLKDPERLVHAMAEKLAVYFTGRAMGFSDRAVLDDISHGVADSNYGFRDLIHATIQSPIFQEK